MQADPSLMYNFRLVYEREVPLKMTLDHAETIKRLKGEKPTVDEMMIVKILVQGAPGAPNPEADPQSIRVEFTSLNDFFFLYVHQVDPLAYEEMRREQGIKGQFADYLTMLVKFFNGMILEPEMYYLHMVFNENNTADLKFKKRLEFKKVTLLKAMFDVANDDTVKLHIRHRHNISKLEME